MISRKSVAACVLSLSRHSVRHGAGRRPTGAQAMADTERDFARTAKTKGIRDSFLDFFAEDSIAFTRIRHRRESGC